MKAEDILKVAQSQVGVSDNGHNKVLYNTEYYGKEVSGNMYPWCCVFVWWVFKTAGASELFYNGKKCASCTMTRDAMASQKVREPKAGDLAFFNFNADSKVEHIGIVKSVNPDGSVITIEGNTSLGNNSNGGHVMERLRKRSLIQCFIRPKYEDASIVISPIRYTVKRGDTLTKIANAYDTTVERIAKDNNIVNINLIRVGQVLTINK